MKKILATILSVILLLSIIPMAYAEEGNTYKVGDIIEFGSYPQSEVKDETLIAELNALAPEWEKWASYGYYTGSGTYYGTIKQGDWMRYIDIKHDGNKYRGVKFTEHRPYYTYLDNPYPEENGYCYNTYQDDNGYRTNLVYWFKFESIAWRVLEPATGLVMCETIIDSQPYSNTFFGNSGEYFNDSLYTNYASDYETSSIRKWLNNDFYNTAFTDGEKEEINTTTLNNDGYYTSVGSIGYEKLDSNSTDDKIFLLSFDEIRNNDLGFNPSNLYYDKARFGQGSDYAKSQGLFVYRRTGDSYNGNSYWILRSPGNRSDVCCGVGAPGNYGSGINVNSTDNGVRPALCFNDIENYNHKHLYTSEITTPATHLEEGVRTYICECTDSYTESIPKLTEHTYEKTVTGPTCTEQGYTTYSCECGDTYIDDYIKENGHSFTNYISDGKTTCSTNGLKIAKCDNCDATDSIVISGDHSFSDEWTIDEDPTCKEEGMKSHHCKYCPARKDFTPIGKLAHDFVTVRVEPTCLDEGYTITACKCGEEIIEPIAPTGHDYDGSKCKICDYDRADDCSCNCHKGGIAGLFWKIINFFNKLFKSKQYCGCGAKHW